MAYFAQIDENNKVTQVIVVSNSELLDQNGIETEKNGVLFCQKLFGGIWKQTSYNANIRKNYAGIDYTYDEQRDAFIPPRPFLSWFLNENTCLWESPVPYPNDGKKYIWDENTTSWIEAQ